MCELSGRNIAACLDKKYYSSEQILRKILKDDNEDISNIAAYMSICKGKWDQYIDGKHILSYLSSSKYFAVYLSHDQDLNAPVEKGSSIVVAMKFLNLLPVIISNTKQLNMYKDIPSLDLYGKVFDSKQFSEFIICSCNNIIRSMISQNLVKIDDNYICQILSMDNTVLLSDVINHKSFPDLLLRRLSMMKEIDNKYYTNVMVPIYSDMIKRYLNGGDNPLGKFKVDDAIEIQKHLKCFDENIVNTNQKSVKILTLPTSIGAYLLGFPIHQFMPDNKTFRSSLSEMGKDFDKYMDNTLKYYEQRDKTCVKFHGCSEITFVNTNDVMMNNVWDYSPFDRVFNVDPTDSKRVFVFTRQEFASLLESKKNPYTRALLSDSVLKEMKLRQELAKIWNLPSCEPLKGMHDTIKNMEFRETLPSSSTYSHGDLSFVSLNGGLADLLATVIMRDIYNH